MRPGSLAFRLALWAGLLGLLQAAAVLLFAYATLERELDAQRRAVLRDKVQHARELLGEAMDADAIRSSAFRLVDLVTGRPELHMAVTAPAAVQPYVTFSREATESLSRLRSDVWAIDAFLDWRAASGSRMLSLAAAARTRSGLPYEIVLSFDRGEDDRLLQRLLLTSATAAPFALALVGLSALVVVSFGLRPLRRFRDATARVSAKTLSARIETASLPVELQDLGGAFNSMLDRLDEGVGRLPQFSSDLAHEMRTPLATVLGRAQVALSQPRTTEQLVDVLEGNIDELQRLSRLVADMLFLAQADHAPDALQLERIDLAHEARRVADFVGLLADERNVVISIDGEAAVTADRGLVQRAITNLLSNAVRHGSPGTAVQLLAKREANMARLDVVNQGEPITAEHLPRLFDRFYRIDRSRARDGGGTGLGLAIVKAIAALHGGGVDAASSADGATRFTLSFPVDPEAPPPSSITNS